MFCLNVEIVEALRDKDFAARLKSLSGIELVRDAKGEPIFFSGNSALVARVLFRGREATMRCYRVHNAHLPLIYGERFFPGELNVAQGCCDAKWIDVALCRWVEGKTLDQTLRDILCCGRNGGSYRDGGHNSLRRLSAQFDSLALNTLRQDWAHGDISLDNIIMRPCVVDGEIQRYDMALIDFDSAYLPSMDSPDGCAERVDRGTPAFQPDKRASNALNKRIDDFSFMLISVALRAMSEDLWLNQLFPFLDGLLLDGKRVGEADYKPLQEVLSLFAARGAFAHYRMAKMLYLRQHSVSHLASIFEFALCEESRQRYLSDEDRALALQRRSRLLRRDPKLFTLFYDEHGAAGYYDERVGINEILLPALFDEAFDFSSGTGSAEVVIGGNSFFIDRSGKTTEEPTRASLWDKI